ncbi:MAG: pseudouridine synthase [Flavobacteriales bacterium]|nr:pseudouridine synthase [Flavobacteriales bacterium]MCB9449718.1 pseudouridine synthase [Flavobacteriales bacterium]
MNQKKSPGRNNAGRKPANRSAGSRPSRPSSDRKPRTSDGPDRKSRTSDGPGRKPKREGETRREGDRPAFSRGDRGFRKPGFSPRGGKPRPYKSRRTEGDNDGRVRLNRYIATSGVCSRREADELIASGLISVNGKVVTELGMKVGPNDEIRYDGRVLRGEKPTYVLLNKPKDFVTTTKDPKERKTVMQLVAKACKERIYPVGRLDRQTTGLLLFTNDGEMAEKLTHPRYGAKKLYHVYLDRELEKPDFDKIKKGIHLEEGIARVDQISFVGDASDKSQVGLEIHIGWNRVVRRIFDKLGYKVTKLDRVIFAGLTKKDLPRGHWRFLSSKEVNMLKSHGEA